MEKGGHRVDSKHYFRFGGHNVCITFADSDVNSISLLPSFVPFRLEDEPENLLFTLYVDDTLRPEKKKTLVRKFDTGNGDTLVYQLPDGGYQYIIRDIGGGDCCLLICNRDFSKCRCALNGNWVMRSFGLNDALMLVYAFAGSFFDTILVHASCILHQGRAYPFIAQSGTGKSTHSSLWMKYIEDAQLMNDDNPIIRIQNSIPGDLESPTIPFVYGSPWSGKTPCYRNIMAPLGAVVQIARAPQNSIERLKTVEALATLLPACSSMKWDTNIYDNLCNSITQIIATTPIYTLHCLPDEEAARVCHAAITVGQ
jgi:hypothetical protein